MGCLAKLACPEALWIQSPACLYFPPAGIQGVCCHAWLFPGCWILTQVILLPQQALSPLIHLPSPSSWGFFFKKTFKFASVFFTSFHFHSKELQYLTACISEFPTSMQIWSSRHGIANATDPYVSESQVNNHCIRGCPQFLVLNEDAQNYHVAENAYYT